MIPNVKMTMMLARFEALNGSSTPFRRAEDNNKQDIDNGAAEYASC